MNLVLFSNIPGIDILAKDFKWFRFASWSSKSGIHFDDSCGDIPDCLI